MPNSTQSKLKVLKGNTWMAHLLIQEVADKAVYMAWNMAEVARWEVWEGDISLLKTPNMGLDSPPTLPPPAREEVKTKKNSKNQ